MKGKKYLLLANVILTVITILYTIDLKIHLISWGVSTHNVLLISIVNLILLILIWLAYVNYDRKYSRFWKIFILLLGLLTIFGALFLFVSKSWLLGIFHLLAGVLMVLSFTYKD